MFWEKNYKQAVNLAFDIFIRNLSGILRSISNDNYVPRKKHTIHLTRIQRLFHSSYGVFHLSSCEK